MGGGGRRCLMPIYLKYLSDKLPLQPRSSALNRKILLEFFARGILCLWWTLVKYNWSCRGSQAQSWPRKDLSARNVDPPLSFFASFQCSFFGQYSRISLSMFFVSTNLILMHGDTSPMNVFVMPVVNEHCQSHIRLKVWAFQLLEYQMVWLDGQF